MKSIYRVAVAALFVATGSSRAVADELSFVGVFSTQTSILVAIRESSNAPRWVKVGERVGSYVVRSFDAKNETIALQNADGVIELKLKDSKVQPAPTMELFESLASHGDGKFPYLVDAYRDCEKNLTKAKGYLVEYEKGATDEKKQKDLQRLRDTIDKLERAKVKLWEQMTERSAEIETLPNQSHEPPQSAAH
jgi:hypothetical protein